MDIELGRTSELRCTRSVSLLLSGTCSVATVFSQHVVWKSGFPIWRFCFVVRAEWSLHCTIALQKLRHVKHQNVSRKKLHTAIPEVHPVSPQRDFQLKYSDVLQIHFVKPDPPFYLEFTRQTFTLQ